jgi:hypothetical protein
VNWRHKNMQHVWVAFLHLCIQCYPRISQRPQLQNIPTSSSHKRGSGKESDITEFEKGPTWSKSCHYSMCIFFAAEIKIWTWKYTSRKYYKLTTFKPYYKKMYHVESDVEQSTGGEEEQMTGSRADCRI